MQKDEAALNTLIAAGVDLNARDTRGYTDAHIYAAEKAGRTADIVTLMGGSERVSELMTGPNKLSASEIGNLYDTFADASRLVALVGGARQVCRHIESRPPEISKSPVRGRQPKSSEIPKL